MLVSQAELRPFGVRSSSESMPAAALHLFEAELSPLALVLLATPCSSGRHRPHSVWGGERPRWLRDATQSDAASLLAAHLYRQVRRQACGSV